MSAHTHIAVLLLIGGWTTVSAAGSAAKAEPQRKESEFPQSRSGQQLLGKRPDLKGLDWIGTPRRQPLKLEGKVTLIRWWTDSCPYCTASLPAIEQLRKQFDAGDFQALAVYHPKPRRKVSAATIRQTAVERQYTGPVAADLRWTVLQRNYLDDHPASPTSISFLLDKNGRIRYVHPGPVFHPSSDPADHLANQDYEDIKRAIQILLAEQKETS